jgi:D-3-phosphoglycerate dehydrogenase
VASLDNPGVIGFLGTTLGAAGVNISRVHLGLASEGRAVSVWNLDQALPESVLDEIRRAPNVSKAAVVHV